MVPNPLRVDTGLPKDTQNMSQATQQRLKILWESQMHNPGAAVRHEETHVLMLSWEEDDLDVKEEVGELRDVFENEYGFDVQHTLLPRSDACLVALRDMANFVLKYNKRNSLLIIYYAGHGFGDADLAPGDIIISGTSPKPNGSSSQNEIIWSHLETPITKATNADVFLIFDCCAAGRLCRPLKRGPDWSTQYQFLGACSADQTTHGPGPNSFTRALIWALRELAKEDNHFTTFKLQRQTMQAPDFPGDQCPLLSERESRDTIGHIIICRKDLSPAMPRTHPTKSENEVSKDRTYLDLRFVFENQLSDEVLEHTAEALRNFRDGPSGKKLDLSRIAFQSKYSATEHALIRWKEAIRKAANESTPLPESGSRILPDAVNLPGLVKLQGGHSTSETVPIVQEPPRQDQQHSLSEISNPIKVDTSGPVDIKSAATPPQSPTMIGSVARTLQLDTEDLSKEQHSKVDSGTQKPVSLASTVVEHSSVNKTGRSVREEWRSIRQSLRHILKAVFTKDTQQTVPGTSSKERQTEDPGEMPIPQPVMVA